MKNLNLKKYSGTAAALMLLVIVALVYGFVLSQVNGYVDRMGIALAESETLSTRDTQARSVEIFLQETAELRDALEDVVIIDTDVVSVIEILEDVARDERVELSISSVSVTQPDGWVHHERVDVVFSIQGSFSRILSFSSIIEALPFAARLEGGRIQLSSGSSWFGSYTVTFIKQKI